jgi:DNA invertase Pin-like site-specific DNA recombinase
MSTEHQKYSIENQLDLIADYAASHGIEIVKTYIDTARSGLSVSGRPAFARLLEDAQSGAADFEIILVYDVSRWGRFQDTDESAHHEFLCKQSGVSVRYCAEEFENEGFAGGIFKVLKRAAAAEYVRELSAKTFAGQCRVLRHGFHVGGIAGYGLRRMLIDERSGSRSPLALGQQKNIKSDRVGLAPGPAHEVETVRRIFTMLVAENKSPYRIAKTLNAEGVPVMPRGIWTGTRVRKILGSERYIGNLIFNRQTQRLGTKLRPNPPEAWVRCESAFEPLVEVELFRAAQKRIEDRRRRTDAELLAALSKLHKARGRLTVKIMEEADALPHPSTYLYRFGSLSHAYALIGHPEPFGPASLRGNETYHRLFLRLPHQIAVQMRAAGAIVEQGPHRTLFRINDEFTLRVVAVPVSRHRRGSLEWRVVLKRFLRADLTLAVRLDEANRGVLDYFLLPPAKSGQVTASLGAKHYRRFRLDSLKPFLRFCSLMASGAIALTELDIFLSRISDSPKG